MCVWLPWGGESACRTDLGLLRAWAGLPTPGHAMSEHSSIQRFVCLMSEPWPLAAAAAVCQVESAWVPVDRSPWYIEIGRCFLSLLHLRARSSNLPGKRVGNMPISDRELEHIRRKQREFLDALLVKKWTTPRLSLGERDALEAGRQVGLPPILVSEFLHYWINCGDLDESWESVANNIQASLGDDPFAEEGSAATQQGKARPLVFMCHASEDKPAVRSFRSRLLEAGFETWLDEEEILPGQDWDSEIRRAIKRSNSVVIFLSQHSQKRGYLQKELRRALDEAELQPEGAIFLIPARLEPCEVPERLSRWQWVDLWTEEGFERLCLSLETHRPQLP